MQQADEISCALCGNQAAADAVPKDGASLPSTERLDINDLQVPETKSENPNDEMDFAVEYFLGFMEAYDKLPAELAAEFDRDISYSPSSAQSAAILDLCTKFEITTEMVLGMASKLYRERDTK